MDKEVWKDIKGYEGLYKISNYGRVKSEKRLRTKGGIIKSSLSTSGYEITHLCKNGKVKTFQVHRLVASHFLDNPYNLPEVNHKDECKINNHVSNLEFCTRIYNQRYGTGIQRRTQSHKYKESAIKSAMHHNYAEVGRKQAKPVLQIDKNGNVIKRWGSIQEIHRSLGYLAGQISSACNGNIKTSYGYRWEFEKNNEKT